MPKKQGLDLTAGIFRVGVDESGSAIRSDGGATDYYRLPNDAEQLQDLIEHKDMSFSTANIFKACYRLGQKYGTSKRTDLNKIIWFANRELALLDKKEADSCVKSTKL